VFIETATRLSQVASRSPRVAVAFSGGKDSLVVLDLCARAFKEVVLVHVYKVPGLGIYERQIKWAQRQYSCDVVRFPNPQYFFHRQEGFYCFPDHVCDEFPNLVIQEILSALPYVLGCPLATGRKAIDNFWTSKKATGEDWMNGDEIRPIHTWRTHEVVGYLASRKIPVPESDGRKSAAGDDLSRPGTLWLYDRHRKDYEKMCRYYPFLPAIVYRRKWYGDEEYPERTGPAAGEETVQEETAAAEAARQPEAGAVAR
jgi:phosphoadenosine phosphosulfate reductase